MLMLFKVSNRLISLQNKYLNEEYDNLSFEGIIQILFCEQEIDAQRDNFGGIV